ncbi:hypothetical protein L195_g025104 [Trifolium pratense]|uniref:Uncharacterized protein n=1 Tax=Trifolium pratense TaxID=57577 RepID=A0A2K3NFJ7_TRIPR|nr:hypothetical protein L195_g025104 [Trifolium pratense]
MKLPYYPCPLLSIVWHLSLSATEMKELAKIASDAQWFRDRVEATRLANLAKTVYEHLDLCLISAFSERWHANTSNFHMHVWKIKVTLDDVNLLGAQPGAALTEVGKTKGNHATLTYLKGLFTDHLAQVVVFTSLSDEQSRCIVAMPLEFT